MSEPDAKPENRTKSRGGCGCLSLLMLLVGYILSPVPLSLMLYQMPGSVQNAMFPVWDVVFWPLQWCYEHFAIVEAFYDWYVSLFDF